MSSLRFGSRGLCFALSVAFTAAGSQVLAQDAKTLVQQEEERTDPVLFYTDLSPDKESSPTDSKAVGHADFSLDRQTLKLTWKITFKDLSSAPTGAHIHGPQRQGVNGSALFDLAPKGVKSPLEGSVVMTEGELDYLLERHLYVNIATAKYKDGELRGQIERLPPKEAQ